MIFCIDLLEIPDLEVWRYGQALRQLAVDLECSNVKFMRLADLLDHEYSEPLTEETYLRHAAGFRKELLDDNLLPNFDASAFITSDPDATLTYRGYIKFLEKDLEKSPLAKSADSKKRYHEDVAKAMMGRGKASLPFRPDGSFS
jgi:pyoverdine/dityrosine biosynthesis protein Dit1